MQIWGISRCSPWHLEKSLARAATDHLVFGKPCSLEGSLAPALLEKSHPASGGRQAASPILQQMLFLGTSSGLFTHDFFFSSYLIFSFSCAAHPGPAKVRPGSAWDVYRKALCAST